VWAAIESKGFLAAAKRYCGRDELLGASNICSAMKSSLRAFLLGINASYWFLPSLLTLFALGLSVLTIELDRAGAGVFLERIGEWDPGAEGARSQLNAIATSMITVAATVFAITIAAVSFASGHYGPRVLANFMRDRGNQLSLGVFVATFVYNLMVLRTVRTEQEDAAAGAFVPHISVLVSTLTLLVAVGTLVYFLHHIPASIRINTVLGGIGRRLMHDIKCRFPDCCRGDDQASFRRGRPVNAPGPGYVEVIDFEGLDQLALDAGVVISLAARTGDFVHAALPLAEVSGGKLDDQGERRMLSAFSLANERTDEQDIEFLFDELVEIALRALSPGVNDPYTAITSLHWMGAAMASLAGRDLRRGPEQAGYDPERVRPVPDDFGHFLRRSFGSARASVAPSVVAGKVFIDSLAGVARGAATEHRRQLVQEEGRTFFAQVEAELGGPALREMRERLARFEAELAGNSDSPSPV
jgi:uncharacterized membrane protein